MEWTTPDDLIAQLHRCWEQGRILSARLTGESLFPLTLRLKRPNTRELSDRFGEVREWMRALQEGSKIARGFGYEITWAEINPRQLGPNQVPTGIVVPSEHDALHLLGKGSQAERFQSLADTTLRLFPVLQNWLIRRPLTVLEQAENWQRILTVLVWFRDHPRSGLYLRQLDIHGVDTKFIEARKGLLSELLERILPAEAVHMQVTGTKGFEQRYGLLSEPPWIRFRLLDKRLYLCGLSDLTIPAAQFARLHLPVQRVFITENKINGLAFPDVPESVVIFGLGYALDCLAEIKWLTEKTVYYWGDIDTHGFAILDRLRATFPHAYSFLMDRATLMAHRDLWVEEIERCERPLQRLTASEQTLFDDLRHDRLGGRVRLEQERISFGWLTQALGTLNHEVGR